MASISPDDPWRPTASWEALCHRAQVLRQLREFFYREGFVEVETPLLCREVVVEAHLDPLSLTLFAHPSRADQGPRYFLQCSPELGMKRLLAAGAKAIFQITRAFRAGEQGPWHNVEFTMLEWYRAGDTQEQALGRLSRLVAQVLHTPGAQVVSYREVFRHHVGVNPWHASAGELRQAVRRLGLGEPAGHWPEDDPEPWRQWLFAQAVQPRLGWERPVIVFGFPPSEAALAQLCGNPPVAQRFELFVQGVELANGYHELTDPEELRRRLEQENHKRRRLGKPPLPLPQKFLALHQAGLPDSWGVALGVDRLVALSCQAQRLEEVIAFPTPRA